MSLPLPQSEFLVLPAHTYSSRETFGLDVMRAQFPELCLLQEPL